MCDYDLSNYVSIYLLFNVIVNLQELVLSFSIIRFAGIAAMIGMILDV